MTFRGRVTNGVVVFDGGSPADGTQVEVRPLDPAQPQAIQDDKSVWDKLLSLAGKAQHLPADAAEQHDHYLYGTPKR